MQITSINNPKVKEWAKLKKKKYRDASKQYLVEGDHLVEEALKAGVVETILSLEPMDTAIEHYQVTEEIIKKLSCVDTPQRIIAICQMTQTQDVKIDGKRFLLLDGLQDPGNIGTLIRTALAFGYDQVIFSDHSVDLYNDKLMRSSQGACFHISCIKLPLEHVIDVLHQHDIIVYGTSLENGKALPTFSVPDKLALVLGNEGNGMSKKILESTDQNIFIPIQTAESLNVAVAGGICMFYFNGID